MSACRSTIAAATLLSAAVALAAPVHGAAPPLRAWRDGPAGYLLDEDEYRSFGTLESDAERRAFIDRFWTELDGDASTPRNEFREAFEARCATADARFETIGSPGWKTDRGRAYVLLGEPSVIREAPGGIKAVATEIWVYGDTAAGAPELRIVFYRCPDGDYRLSPACPAVSDRTSVAVDWERTEYVRRLRESNPALARGRVRFIAEMFVTSDPGGLPRPKPPATREETAGDPAARGASAPAPQGTIEDAAYFFRAQDGTVLAILTLLLNDGRGEHDREGELAAGPRFSGAVAIAEAADPGAPRSVALETETPAAGRGPPALFGRTHLRAGGVYDLRYAIRDAARDEILVRHVRLDVPDMNSGLAASSVVPAERYGPAPGGDGRFRVGSDEVVPKPGKTFRRSEMLRLYLQVYGAGEDPATSRPQVDVAFRFYRLVRGADRRHGKPFTVRGAAGAAMGLSLPIGDWPPGPYRVAVELRDRIAGRRAVAEGTFAIAEE